MKKSVIDKYMTYSIEWGDWVVGFMNAQKTIWGEEIMSIGKRRDAKGISTMARMSAVCVLGLLLVLLGGAVLHSNAKSSCRVERVYVCKDGDVQGKLKFFSHPFRVLSN